MCGCGCNTCETDSTALMLNESKAPRTILSEGLKHHIDNNKPLTEHFYRAGSRDYFNLIAEARYLYSRGILEFTNKRDIELLTETDQGYFGVYEGKKVPLDFPMLDEIDEDDEYEIASRKLFDMTWDEVRRQNNQDMVQDVHDEVSKDDEEDWDDDDNFYTLRESSNESKYHKEETTQQTIDRLKARIDDPNDGGNVPFLVQKIKDLEKSLDEAKFKGKTVDLNKPTRGDSKKFKVYVNSGKKNADGSIKVKKVNFGHGGTTAKKAGQKTMKIRKSNPKARKAFRARHNCDNPGPKTMARYWSCKKW